MPLPGSLPCPRWIGSPSEYHLAGNREFFVGVEPTEPVCEAPRRRERLQRYRAALAFPTLNVIEAWFGWQAENGEVGHWDFQAAAAPEL